MLVFCIMVSIMFTASLLYIYLIKQDIRQIGRKLNVISKEDSNPSLNTTTFDKDITNLVNVMNEALRQYKIALVDKNQAEADLKRGITNISHDLRTPLTSAIGYLQMLEDSLRLGKQDPIEMRYIQIIAERLQALSVLMENLFEFTKIMEGNTKFDIQKINICSILRDVLSTHYLELSEKGFTVEVLVPEAPIYCFLDETVFRRVLNNMIKNVYVHGVDYMKVWLDGTNIHITNKVSDSPFVDVTKIFERFYTSDASRTRKNTGLGLAIVKELMAGMGGGVTAKMEEDRLDMKLVLPSKKKK